MPRLDWKYETCFAEVAEFFMPEIPENHTLKITKITKEFQYAGYHGLSNRKYKIVSDDWTF